MSGDGKCYGGEKKKPEEGPAHNGPREALLQVVTLEGDPEVRVRGARGHSEKGVWQREEPELKPPGWERGRQVGGAAAERSRGGCWQGGGGGQWESGLAESTVR